MKKHIAFALAVLILAVIGILITGGPSQASVQARGIDISAYQHPGGEAINWSEVRHDGNTFAFIKDTEGDYYVNPWYATDLREAQSQGIKVGSYAFARPNYTNGGEQAEYLLSHGGYKPGMIAPTLDIEWNVYAGNTCYNETPGQIVAFVTAFEDVIHQKLGMWAIINTPESWWNLCTGRNTSWGARVPLWDENNHGAYPPYPTPMPSGWAHWKYWQSTNRGSVPGVPGTVDLNVED